MKGKAGARDTIQMQARKVKAREYNGFIIRVGKKLTMPELRRAYLKFLAERAQEQERDLRIRRPVLPQPKLITGGEMRPLALTLIPTLTLTLTPTLTLTLALTLTPNREPTCSPSSYPGPPPNPDQVLRCSPTSWCAPPRRHQLHRARAGRPQPLACPAGWPGLAGRPLQERAQRHPGRRDGAGQEGAIHRAARAPQGAQRDGLALNPSLNTTVLNLIPYPR